LISDETVELPLLARWGLKSTSKVTVAPSEV